MNETELIDQLQKAKSVFLLEPPYRRKYVPLGLAKIASLVKSNGGTAEYGRHYNGQPVDLVVISTLFTYFSREVFEAIREVESFGKTPIVGGVYASLMPKHIQKEFPQVPIFTGYSQVLDSYVPDYSMDWGVQAPFDKYSYVFTERGCPNQCPYCAVWRIEPGRWDNPNWKAHVVPEKPWTMIYDNNPGWDTARCIDVINYLIEQKKYVEFNNGFDIKHLVPEVAERLGKLRYARRGLRMSFDRIAEDGLFQEKVQLLIDRGVGKSHMFAYVLFNFTDTPAEADYRCHECVRLGIEPYPTMYIPLHYTDRHQEFIGKHWTHNLVKAFRFFYMMAGYYTKMRFRDFISNRDLMTKHKFEINNEDLCQLDTPFN